MFRKKESKFAVREALHEECGVAAAFSLKGNDVSQILYLAVVALQHRGQDSAGMAILDGGKIRIHRDLGLVSDVFKKQDLKSLHGTVGISHVRYPTIGAGGPQDAQPFCQSSPIGDIALGHNGNIANYGVQRSKLEAEGYKLSSTCDADLILANFVKNLKKSKNSIFSACAGVMEDLDGSYSVCAITQNGELIVFRDPHAIRPLCWGSDGDTIMFASESVALDINEIPLKGDVLPGEAILITKKGTERKIVAKKTSKRHCAFEYVYFSRPDSIEEGKLVYDARLELGRRLAKASPVKADIVVAVPDTSRAASIGYSEVSGIPIAEGLMKNRYIGRTFIMASQEKRIEAVRLKLNAVGPIVKGKKIVLIDDSIVRGTTVGPIVKLLRKAGAKEIHLRISCPPIISPCFYGVDLPTFEELAASSHSVEEIRKMSGADSLAYLPVSDLVASIGKPHSELCLGCMEGKYPTALGDRLAKIIKEKGPKDDIRIWEEKEI